MSHTYKLSLTKEETGEEITLAGEFSDEDWRHLEEFSQYAKELISTKFVQDGMPASLKLHWDANSGMSVLSRLPPWDDVTVFLHKFRPLGLQSESTYFYKICNLLTRELTHPYFRSMIDLQREIFSGKVMQAQFRIQSDEVVLNSEKVLYDWLNAYEYHRDKEKREFIESLHTMLPLDASKVLFLSLLTEKTEAINNIAALIMVVIGKQKRVEGLARRQNES